MAISTVSVPMVGPNSPCISICALDAQGYCSGCLRTGAEIAGWIRMTPDEQWSLLAVLDERRSAAQREREIARANKSRRE